MFYCLIIIGQKIFIGYILATDNIFEKERNDLIIKLSKQGIECRPGLTSLSKMQPHEKYANGQFKISNYFSEKTISLPSSKLTKSDQISFLRN